MHCFMCLSSDSKLKKFQGDMDNDTVKIITSVLPDLLIPEYMDSAFICSTCLEQVKLFYTIKKTSLENNYRLKYFNAMLKGTNNFKCSELRVIINSVEVSAQHKHRIHFNVNPNSKYLLSSEGQAVTHIKEEDKTYDYHYQQLDNEESNLNHLQGDSSSWNSNNNTQRHKSLVDSNLTSSDGRCKDQPKIQREIQKKRFKCTECHKTFLKRNHLDQHIPVHTGEKPYKCKTCQKTFKRLGHLCRHKLIHTGEKPHECDVCYKKFNRKGNLVDHKRIHNNVRPYKCAVCSKAFTTSSSLNKHMFIHTGEKPHQCHLCEYKCADASHLKRHIRSHTGEKPYSCKHCDKTFTTSSALKRHERRLHSNEDSR